MSTQSGATLASRYGNGNLSGVHWPRTLMQKADQPLGRHQLRYRHRNRAGGALHCLVLDCSASMLAGRNLSLAKGMLLAWMQQFYRERAHVCVITFAGAGANLIQPPLKTSQVNEPWIAPIQGGGGSPVAAGLQLAERVLARSRRRSPQMTTALWLWTDARFSALPERPNYADRCTVVDFENTPVRLGRAQQLAQRWQGEYARADELSFPNQHRGQQHAY